MKAARCTPIFLLTAAALCLSSARLQAHSAAEEMALAANRLLAALTPQQHSQAAFEFHAKQRLDWHFIPMDRNGLALKDMSPDQRQLALALLKSGSSKHGFNQATNIMSLESILADLEGPKRRFPRDPDLYHIFIFGQPDPQGTWSWRFEGHHLSIHFTIINGKFFGSTPSFFGTNPAEVRQGPRKGLRVLANEEDLGRKLVQSLKPEQRKKAILGDVAPRDVLTAANSRVTPLPSDEGVAAKDLSFKQRRLLMKIIREYVEKIRPELASADLKKIKKAGIKNVLFAWAGSLEKGQGHYYRVQGPTFLLEYDNTQNNANHVHAVWRDFENDYGLDLLKKHYQQHPHEK
jgi:hypothetical protein